MTIPQAIAIVRAATPRKWKLIGRINKDARDVVGFAWETGAPGEHANIVLEFDVPRIDGAASDKRFRAEVHNAFSDAIAECDLATRIASVETVTARVQKPS